MKIISKNYLLLLLSILSVFASVFFAAAQTATNNAPFVIPALREWHGGTGQFILRNNASVVIAPKYYELLLPKAKTFVADLQMLKSNAHFLIRQGKPREGDIFLTLETADSSLKKEGYLLSINHFIRIEAFDPAGVFWATRSLLQILEQDRLHEAIPRGIAKDFPQFEVRGFVLDCGRKFFTMDFLRKYVRFMSYYKMNDFHIHLNDNGFKGFFGDNWDSTYSAFRLESKTYPNLTSKDGFYTKQAFIELQQLAASYGVTIVPEIDVPAHSLAFTKAVPQIGSSKYGRDHLDLDNPLTYEVIDHVFKEYLQGPDPVFRGKEVHIGTDEYAKNESEKFRAFTDHYIRFVESFGKKVRLWGALTHAAGTTPVKSENVTMNLWYNGYADPKEMLKQGYNGISTPDGWLYIVPAAGYYYDYLNTQKIYRKWTPNMIGNQVFAENDPQIRGGAFAVWNDHVGNGITEKDVHDRVFPAMQTLAVKMWDGSDTSVSYETFLSLSKNLSEGPGLNMRGKIKGKDSLVLQYNKPLKLTGGASHIETPYKEIGYGYTVSFEINPAKDNKDDAVLFSSPDAVVKLKQQSTNQLGFSREGYHYTFNYAVPPGVWTHIVITGNNKGTSLYVNGILTDKLEGNMRVFANGKKTAKVQTLFFPLQFIGDTHNAFKGVMNHIKVFNCILPPDKIAAL